MYNNFVEADDSLFSEIQDILKGKSLENRLRVGCFKRDVSVQTDVSELPSLQTLGENNSTLRMDMEVVKKEVAVKMKCLEAQYITVIQREAIDLYTLMQRKSRNAEDMHKEKIALLQKSYQNQLVEAIHIIKDSFKKSPTQNKISIPGGQTDNRIVEELLTKLEEQSFEMLILTEKVAEYEEQLNTMSYAEDTGETDTDWLKDENGRLEEENEKLNDDIDSLHIDLEQLREDLEAKEKNIEALANDLKQLTIKANEERRTVQKMTMENNQLKVQLTNEKDAGRKKLNELKKGMEKEIDNIEAMRRKELLAAEEIMEQQKQEQREMGMRHDALMSQKMAAAAKPTAVEDKTESTKPPSTLEKMEKLVAEQKTEIKRLKKDLRITIATWEKKFEILTKSFHAIKDEMFLRNNFQRQSAALHFASVSYTRDMPGKKAADNPGKQTVFTAGTPLPNIGAGPQRSDRTCASGMSSCVSSCVSSRVTDTLSRIGHEVQSQHEDGDDEDFGCDLPLPLPPPPSRKHPAFAES